MGEHAGRVSVVIPLYQKADVVAETLASVLRQTRDDFEVVVVDDGSTDGSHDVVAAVGDPRVRIVRQENQGESAARNRGIIEARNEWIAFLDSDDLWMETHLEELVSAASMGDAIAVFSNYILKSRNRPVISLSVPSQRVTDFFAFALRIYGYPMHPSAVLVRRSALIEAGSFPVGKPVGGDTDTWCRLALKGPFRYVASPTAEYCDGHPTSILARYLRTSPQPPPFAETLACVLREGAVPGHLVLSARRYENFLMLEFARQLLDNGQTGRARQVLLEHCTFAWDPVRYLKRLARTSPVGHSFFSLTRRLGHVG